MIRAAARRSRVALVAFLAVGAAACSVLAHLDTESFDPSTDASGDGSPDDAAPRADDGATLDAEAMFDAAPPADTDASDSGGVTGVDAATDAEAPVDFCTAQAANDSGVQFCDDFDERGSLVIQPGGWQTGPSLGADGGVANDDAAFSAPNDLQFFAPASPDRNDYDVFSLTVPATPHTVTFEFELRVDVLASYCDVTQFLPTSDMELNLTVYAAATNGADGVHLWLNESYPTVDGGSASDPHPFPDAFGLGTWQHVIVHFDYSDPSQYIVDTSFGSTPEILPTALAGTASSASKIDTALFEVGLSSGIPGASPACSVALDNFVVRRP